MILTIDLGTTNCKSAIWDDQMNMLSCAAEELPLITMSDNIIEQDANTMWESALRTAKTALQAENVSPMQIEAAYGLHALSPVRRMRYGPYYGLGNDDV